MITIVPYNPGWCNEFCRLAEPLQTVLGELAIRIDHIGSTAIPNLPAKDVIDIQITVAHFTPQLEVTLSLLGYQRRTDVTADHIPAGFVGATHEWEKWYFRPPAGQRPTHLHIRVYKRANQRYALLFRDYLRTHPLAAQAYGVIKQQLAVYHSTDVDAYYNIKDPVCDLVWQAAEDWARNSAWQQQEIEATAT